MHTLVPSVAKTVSTSLAPKVSAIQGRAGTLEHKVQVIASKTASQQDDSNALKSDLQAVREELALSHANRPPPMPSQLAEENEWERP